MMSQMPQQAALSKCPSCEEPLEAGDRFCGACGYDLSAVPARPQDQPTIAMNGSVPPPSPPEGGFPPPPPAPPAAPSWPAAPGSPGTPASSETHRPDAAGHGPAEGSAAPFPAAPQ
ncbi:zinc ribbon domain-containing protein, partial [Streptomyces thermospinosisporus]|uniref:zinc ribbon domain-containing protein n=1 Tax=Streptomyces thermospinosisporus TaxID=161482 RepID=UPI003CD07103